MTGGSQFRGKTPLCLFCAGLILLTIPPYLRGIETDQTDLAAIREFYGIAVVDMDNFLCLASFI
jgi:hypothetical protein